MAKEDRPVPLPEMLNITIIVEGTNGEPVAIQRSMGVPRARFYGEFAACLEHLRRFISLERLWPGENRGERRPDWL